MQFDDSAGATKFKFNSNGNAYVDGVLTAKELKAKTNVWADYVFEKGYKLMSLKDLEQYIKENKHLPNIPSSKEVIENGISLGEMQQKQMEKIEELTLHLIEKDKQIDNLNKRLEALEAKLNN